MATYVVDVRAMGKRLRADAEARGAAVQTSMLEAAYQALSTLVRSAPKDMGPLRQSGHVEPGDKPAVVFDAPYAGIVEAGARPHMPPLDPILRWTRRHLAAFNVGPDADPDEAAQRIAQAIRWRIYNHGTRPRWFVRGNLPRLQAQLRRIVVRRLRELG